jgi:hypothetical protein
VRELGTACAFADRPDLRCGCFQALVDLYMALRRNLMKPKQA